MNQTLTLAVKRPRKRNDSGLIPFKRILNDTLNTTFNKPYIRSSEGENNEEVSF